MRIPGKSLLIIAAIAAGIAAANLPIWGQAGATPLAGTWSLIKEGQAEGTIEHPARHPTNPAANLLQISVTKYAAHPGEGRLGAKNSQAIAVQEGQWYDITFTGTRDQVPGLSAGVGLVFSLETPEGKVLARTTLPEIGRGARGGGGGGGGRGRGNRGGEGAAPATAPAAPTATAPGGAPWRSYLVSVYVRESAPAAHLTVCPIEPAPVWIENLSITLRK